MDYGRDVGYSEKIKQLQFRKGQTKGAAGVAKIILCLGPLLIAAFLFLAFQGILPADTALILGGTAGLASVILYTFFSRRNGEVKTFDAILVKKKRLRKKGSAAEEDMLFLLVFATAEGREIPLNVSDRKALFRYYREGDRVRFHSGFPYPEKFEKNFDDQIICVLCGKLTEVTADKCRSCNHLLLK